MRSRTLQLGIVVLAFIVSISSASAKKLTKEQKEWIAKRDRQPTTFVVKAEESDSAWERARQWIANYALLPIQISDETLIQTSATADLGDARTEITVTRTKLEDGSFTFRIQGRNGNVFARGAALNQIRALAYYVASGIPYPE